MSDADSLNNQPLPELIGPTDERTADLLDVTVTEEPQTVSASELTHLQDVVHQLRHERTPDLDTVTETPEAALAERSKDGDWFTMAQKCASATVAYSIK